MVYLDWFAYKTGIGSGEKFRYLSIDECLVKRFRKKTINSETWIRIRGSIDFNKPRLNNKEEIINDFEEWDLYKGEYKFCVEVLPESTSALDKLIEYLSDKKAGKSVSKARTYSSNN